MWYYVVASGIACRTCLWRGKKKYLSACCSHGQVEDAFCFLVLHSGAVALNGTQGSFIARINRFQAVSLFLQTRSVPCFTSFVGLPKHRFNDWLKMMLV